MSFVDYNHPHPHHRKAEAAAAGAANNNYFIPMRMILKNLIEGRLEARTPGNTKSTILPFKSGEHLYEV